MTFKVRIKSSDREFTVEPGETVLAAALREGVTLAYSCRNGACGTCKGRILAGAVDFGQYEKKALSDAERAEGKALLCQARPSSDLLIEAREIAAARDIPIRIMPCRVARMERAAQDVMILKLKLPEGQRLQYLAGQYVDILLRNNERRSFSLATPPLADELLELHVREVPGGYFTGHVFKNMKERDLLRFQGPLGTFFLRQDESTSNGGDDRPAILMAGGTGFAPIKAIIMDALARGDEREFHLYWGARARRDLYMDGLCREWAQANPRLRYTPVLSEPLAEDAWTGRTGWVHEAVVEDHPDLGAFEVYCSGPPPMIEAGKAAFAAHGLPDDRLYFDSFEFAHAR